LRVAFFGHDTGFVEGASLIADFGCYVRVANAIQGAFQVHRHGADCVNARVDPVIEALTDGVF
jgi:hypothetical protein